MKTYVLMISKAFMKGHPRAGEPTHFREKILNAFSHQCKDDRGLIYLAKRHTIRENYEYWARIASEVNARRGILSLRQWTGSPYNFQRDGSKQEEFLRLTKMGVQRVNVFKVRDQILKIVIPELKKVSIQYYGSFPIMHNVTVPQRDWQFFQTICSNDGLRDFDFMSWFNKPVENGAIIHFTDFRYA